MTEDFKGFTKPQSNYSKLPHDFIDRLPEMDTLAEMKVVIYILRHTWGFSEYDKPKKMTTDEFENGRKKRDGTRIDSGTGLSSNSIRAGLEKAVQHGFITIDIDDSDRARIEKWYSLNMAVDSEIESRPANSAPRPANSEDRTEKETKERKELIVEQADKKVDAILAFEAQAKQAEEEGKAWRGRELLMTDYQPYGDWWHSQTGLHMYGAKAKAKADTGWIKAFKELHENEVSIPNCQAAYNHVIAWKKVIANPLEIIEQAKAFQAAPAHKTDAPAATISNGKVSSY